MRRGPTLNHRNVATRAAVETGKTATLPATAC
jgi:hypothetical protein